MCVLRGFDDGATEVAHVKIVALGNTDEQIVLEVNPT